MFKINKNSFCQKNFIMNSITPKESNENISLANILSNEIYVNDLLININSSFKKLINIDNIYTLIRICLFPNITMNEYSKEERKKAYYSSLLLCSDNILHFKYSLKSLVNVNNKNNNSNFLIESDKESNEEEILNKDINNSCNCEIGENSNKILLNENIIEKYDNFLSLKISESKRDFEGIKNVDYNDDERNMIKNILNKIFESLDYNNYTQSYLDYFSKIINYLLYNEQNIIIHYLFEESPSIINKICKYLNNDSIKNLFENILNILSDNEENDIYYSKYMAIINKLFELLFDEQKSEAFENISDLIINTLLSNTEKHFIEFIFNNDNTLLKIINLIQKIINQKNDDRIIIAIIKLLLNINNIILSSIGNTKNSKTDDILSEDNIKYNYFEFKYFCSKNIQIENIFNAYIEKGYYYLEKMNEIFNIITEDIKNNDINNHFFKQSDVKKNKFSLKKIYEWKFILSCLKLYISSIKNLNNESKKIDYFKDEDLFNISIKLYFNFSLNNIYQNIFLEIIKLINDEKCPDYLITPFLLLNENEDQNSFILKIINNLKGIKENKSNKLLIGLNIEILRIFYFSKNKTIINSFNVNKKDKIYKDNFINCINPKFERKLKDEYEYCDSEIFNSINENEDTFDGNDSFNITRNIFSLNLLIEKFLEKCEKEEKY